MVMSFSPHVADKSLFGGIRDHVALALNSGIFSFGQSAASGNNNPRGYHKHSVVVMRCAKVSGAGVLANCDT
jgi:hypothetical protein